MWNLECLSPWLAPDFCSATAVEGSSSIVFTFLRTLPPSCDSSSLLRGFAWAALLLQANGAIGASTISSISLQTAILGSTMNSMKPICDSATKVLLRSHKGLKGSPSSRSRSPWRKNSSSRSIVHRWCRFHLLDGCEISQQWRTKESAFDLSTCGSLSVSRFFMFLSCWKWNDMSVASTMSMTRVRSSRNSSRDKFCSTLHSSSRSTRNAALIWWFSRTARSL